MATLAKNCVSTVIPGIHYRDALAAIDWLCRAFGLEKRAVYTTGDIVEHAELTFGNGMVMIGSVAKPSPYAQYIGTPQQAGFVTQSTYLIVSDCPAVYASAQAAGAEIILPLEAKEYGGRAFTCRDPE